MSGRAGSALLVQYPGEEGEEPGVIDQRRGKKAVSGNRKGPEVCGRNKNICDGKQQELKV